MVNMPELVTDLGTPKSVFGSGWRRIPLWVLFLIPWFWPGLVLHYRHYRLHQLYEHGTRSTAVVVDKHPEDHNSVGFRYTVGTTQFTGRGSTPASGLPDLSALSVGDTIPVIYLASNPANAIPGDLKDYWRVFTLEYTMLLAGATFITLLGVIARRSLRAK